MNVLDAVDAASLRKGVIAFRSGDEIKVHVRVIEGNKSSSQSSSSYSAHSPLAQPST